MGVALATLVAAGAMPGGDALFAQQQGAAAAPVSATSFEVDGIDVDVSAKSGEAARMGGFRQAQRLGWKMLYSRMTGNPMTAAPTLGDSVLDGLVSGIIVEREQVSSNRYIARLGVTFDRARAGQLLGVKGQVLRSPPMLLIPVMIDGGTARTFEAQTPWLRAWARFRAGASPVDYVRPAGVGVDRLLLNYGQTQRANRDWWLSILDQYGASDVLVVEVRLDRDYPGGPVTGRFVGRHGPDGIVLTRFALRTSASTGLDAMFDEAVKRMDAAFGGALRDGRLKPDPALRFNDVADVDLAEAIIPEQPATAQATLHVTVDTPDSATIGTLQSALRLTANVTNVSIESLSIGGVSRVEIGYTGDLATLRWALDQRGLRLDEGQGGYRLRRRKEGEAPIPQPAPPLPQPAQGPTPQPAAAGGGPGNLLPAGFSGRN